MRKGGITTLFIVYYLVAAIGNVGGSTITKLEGCSTPDSTSCQILTYYLKYQKVKCLTKEQVKLVGKGLFECKEPNQNCWYPDCQMRLTNLAFERTVRTQCLCTDESRNYCREQVDAGKKSCLKLERYESEQSVSCWRSQDLLMATHTTGCPFPQTHCWFPCQSEKHHEESGKVSDDCKCNSNNFNNNNNGASTTRNNGYSLVLLSLLLVIVANLL